MQPLPLPQSLIAPEVYPLADECPDNTHIPALHKIVKIVVHHQRINPIGEPEREAGLSCVQVYGQIDNLLPVAGQYKIVPDSVVGRLQIENG